jgi:alkaline phosphatase
MAGAYFRDPYGKRAKTPGNVFADYDKAGYNIVRGSNGYRDAMERDAQRILWLDNDTTTENRIGYAIDGPIDDVTLPLMVRSGIDFLYQKYPQGFFMMAEGGAIDHMGHGNDAAGMVCEIREFDAAIREAYNFYLQHPDETLIIVTADHETGGIVLGYTGQYKLNLKALSSQKVSIDKLAAMLSAMGETTWGKVAELVKENIGVEPRGNHNADEDVEMTSDLAKRIAYEAIYDLDRAALLSWASGNHSGTFVPLFAIGENADRFNGVIDNTDIPLIIKSFFTDNDSKE